MRWPDDRLGIKKSFEREGYVVVEQLFPPDELDEIRERLNRYLVERVPLLPKMDVFYEQGPDGKQIKQLPRMNHHDEFFRGLLEKSSLREITETFWSESAIPKDVAFFDKPIGNNHPTPPHQDGFYFRLKPCVALTAWLALETVDEGNGCVRYVKGSHKHGMRPHNRTNVLGFSQGIDDFPVTGDSQNEVAVCVSPGDVIFHDSLTIHRAEKNESLHRSRPAIGFVYFSCQAEEDVAGNEAYQESLAQEWQAEGKI